MRIAGTRVALVLAWLAPALPLPASAADPEPEGPRSLKLPGLTLHVNLPARDGLHAFYTGRGFPASALAVLDRACFVGISLRNPRDEVVWIDLERWQARGIDGKTVARIDRAGWRSLWEAANVPAGARATFGWTLLPESRDLRFDEPVGGNLTLVRTEQPFTLTLVLPTGTDRAGEPLVVEIPGLRCR